MPGDGAVQIDGKKESVEDCPLPKFEDGPECGLLLIAFSQGIYSSSELHA